MADGSQFVCLRNLLFRPGKSLGSFLHPFFQILIQMQQFAVRGSESLTIIENFLINLPDPFKKQGCGSSQNQHESVDSSAVGTDGFPHFPVL